MLSPVVEKAWSYTALITKIPDHYTVAHKRLLLLYEHGGFRPNAEVDVLKMQAFRNIRCSHALRGFVRNIQLTEIWLLLRYTWRHYQSMFAALSNE